MDYREDRLRRELGLYNFLHDGFRDRIDTKTRFSSYVPSQSHTNIPKQPSRGGGATNLLVASSKIKTPLLRTMALAKQSSCFSPTDHEDEGLGQLRPPLLATRSHRFSLCSAAMIVSSGTVPDRSTLNRSDPGMRKGSWGTTLIRERRSVGTRRDMSAPSILTEPSNLIMCRRLRINDVLPLPELPQMATFSPALIDSDTCFRTREPPGL